MAADIGIDISKNIKHIERIKCELLEEVSLLYKLLCDGDGDVYESVTSELSNIIIKSFLLGKRLGISNVAIQAEMVNKLKLGILNEEELEQDFKDYSDLLQFIKGRSI